MSQSHPFFTVMTAIMIFFLIVNSFQALLLMLSVPELWSHWQLGDDEYFRALIGTEALPPISVVATLHDTERDAVRFAEMLLGLEYPRHEVVLVHDGSGTAMLAALTAAFDLYEVPPAFTVHLKTQPVRAYYRSRTHARLVCIDKEPGGRGDAMNAGINAARYPHALSVGSNIVFESDALLRLSRPFLLDRAVAAVGGTLRAANGAHIENGRLVPGRIHGWTLGCQTIEYLTNFLFQRLGWNRIASNLVFPGNAALFKREHVFAVGGFRADSPSPGPDFAIRLHRALTDTGVNPLMVVIPDQIAWTMIPEEIGSVGRARRRWQVGLVKSLAAQGGLFGNPEYGSFGLVAVPYLWIAIIAAPIIELLGYAGLVAGLAIGVLDAPFAAAYLASVVGYGILLSVWTVILQVVTFQRVERRSEVAHLFMFAVLESLGYRQVLAWYRATAFFVDRSPKRSHG